MASALALASTMRGLGLGFGFEEIWPQDVEFLSMVNNNNKQRTE